MARAAFKRVGEQATRGLTDVSDDCLTQKIPCRSFGICVKHSLAGLRNVFSRKLTFLGKRVNEEVERQETEVKLTVGSFERWREQPLNALVAWKLAHEQATRGLTDVSDNCLTQKIPHRFFDICVKHSLADFEMFSREN
jgi:hypothetical protein